MTNNNRRGPIPSELGWLADWMDGVEGRLGDYAAPSGAQRAGTAGHLAGLKTEGATMTVLSTGTVPNDNVTRWFTSSPPLRVDNIYAPTGKLIVTAGVGEASITPGGSFVIAYIGFYVYDSSNAVVPGIGFRNGARYTNIREGIGLTTQPQFIEIADPDANPGPYSVRVQFGMWCASANTLACSTQFSDGSLIVQVVGEGRAL